MKKRLFLASAIVLVVVLALFAFTACNSGDVAYDTELVQNGGFDKVTTSDSKIKIDGWSVKSDWSSNSTYSKDEGEYLNITNKSASYAYLYQEVKVDRNAIYRVKVDMKLPKSLSKGNDTTYRGAYVTFLENVNYFFVEQTAATNGWQTYEFYVKPVDSDYLTICLTLGAEDASVKGSVYFDNVSMMKVEEAAEGFTVHKFTKEEISRYNTNVSGILFVVLLAVFSVAIVVAGYVLIRRLYSKKTAFINFSDNGNGGKGAKGSAVATNPWFIASMLAIGAFIVNLIFLLTMYGFGSEMTYTVNLAKALSAKGAVRSAYATYGTSLQSTSPGVLYILALVGMAGKNLDFDGISILIRMVNVLATMATVVMIYFYGRKYVGDRQSTIFAAMYALLPITFVMGGLDNTFTALLVALVLGTLICLAEKKTLPTYLLLSLSALLDVRALAIAPIVIACLCYRYYKADDTMKSFGKQRAEIVFGLVGVFVLLYVLTIPVAIDYIAAADSKPFYGWTLIANEFMKKTVFVDNGIGLYAMATMNQKTSSSTAAILNFIFILVLEAYIVSLYLKNRNKQELIMLSSFTFAMLAVFTLKIDYTYLFLAVALGFIYAMVSGEKRAYVVSSAYAFLAFLNIGQLMNNSGFVASTSYFTSMIAEGDVAYFANYETTSPELIVFSVFAVLVSLYYAYVSYSISNNGKLVDIPAMSEPFALTIKEWFASFGDNVKKIFTKSNNN